MAKQRPANTAAIVAIARRFLGDPYVWGGETPGGFDCSGLVQYVYKIAGIDLPRTTYDQYKVGLPIPKGNLQPGDIVFFRRTKAGPGHEGLYIGNGKFIEAARTGTNVRVSKLAGRTDFVGARRIIRGGKGFADAVDTAASGASAPAQAQSTGPAEGAVELPKYDGPLPTSTGLREPTNLPPGSVPATGFDPRILAETWQLIATQSGASPETFSYASVVSPDA